MSPPAPPVPEVSNRAIVKTVLCVAAVLVAVVLVGSQLKTTETHSASRKTGRRTSPAEGILQNAGHVIKRTKGYKIERY